MKKTVFIMALLMCLSQFAACGDKNEGGDKGNSGISKDTEVSVNLSSQVDEFIDLVKDGEYLKAVEYYEGKLYGNYQYESEASDGIEALLKNLNREILNGQKSESDSKKITGAVDNVLSKTNINIADYDVLKANINGSIASKAAFLAGKELEGLEKYVDAIEEYAAVIESDSDYAEAQNAIDRCVQTAKKDVLATAKAFVDEGKYVEAITELEELNSKLPDKDSELESKMNVYKKAYASDTIEKAEEAFVTPATDYRAALDIINAALQYLPDDEDLGKKKTYYQSFAPVNLYDMEVLKGKADTKTTDEDIYGNEYVKCFWAGYSSMIWNETDITYNLNNAYNTFEAIVYCRSNKNEAQNMTVEIYADGKVVYQDLKIPDNSTVAFAIDLDVTSVNDLRIVLGRSDGAIGAGIGMTDMIIQRTKK